MKRYKTKNMSPALLYICFTIRIYEIYINTYNQGNSASRNFKTGEMSWCGRYLVSGIVLLSLHIYTMLLY